MAFLFNITGCIDSKLSDSQTVNDASALAFFDEDGAAVQIVDARDPDKWVYFDLDTFSIVFPEKPENDLQWDIAFQRFKVKSNGGVSGIAGVSAASMKDTFILDVQGIPADGYYVDRSLQDLTDDELLSIGGNDFFAVCAAGFDDSDKQTYCLADDVVNRNRLNPNEYAYALLTQGSGVVVDEQGEDGDPILGWYDYYSADGHILRPANDTWVLISSDGIVFSLEMLGYYGYEEGDAESGTVAFRFLALTPGFEIPQPGEQQLALTASVKTPTGAAPFNASFTASVSGAVGSVNYTWDFDDGNASSNNRNPSYRYTNAGTYTVTVTAYDERGIGTAVTESIIVTVTEQGAQPPVANAGPDQLLVMSSGSTLVVDLDATASVDPDGNIVSYTWSGYSIDPADSSVATISLAPGGYEFLLEVADDYGNKATDAVAVTVNTASNESPNAIANADITTGEEPLTVQFNSLSSSDNDGSIVSYSWDFGDGSPISTSANPAHEFTLAGSYLVALTVTDNDGVSSESIMQVIVDAAGTNYPVVEDTYMYEFFGNQADDPLKPGDSGGINVWNHESNHGTKGLLAFDDSILLDPAIVAGAGKYKAKLFLYAVCEPSGFIAACAGDTDSDNPFTPGTATVKTDIFLQAASWSDSGPLVWNDITETGSPTVTLTQDGTGWYEVDISNHVEAWRLAGTTGNGLSLSQENYPVIRADSASIAVSSFCDSESSEGNCAAGDYRPFIKVVPVE